LTLWAIREHQPRSIRHIETDLYPGDLLQQRHVHGERSLPFATNAAKRVMGPKMTLADALPGEPFVEHSGQDLDMAKLETLYIVISSRHPEVRSRPNVTFHPAETSRLELPKAPKAPRETLRMVTRGRGMLRSAFALRYEIPLLIHCLRWTHTFPTLHYQTFVTQ
jgi:hypothetical protein